MATAIKSIKSIFIPSQSFFYFSETVFVRFFLVVGESLENENWIGKLINEYLAERHMWLTWNS